MQQTIFHPQLADLFFNFILLASPRHNYKIQTRNNNKRNNFRDWQGHRNSLRQLLQAQRSTAIQMEQLSCINSCVVWAR